MSEATWQEHVVPETFDNDILPFWEGLKRHEFLLYTCKKTGKHYWPMTLCRDDNDVTLEDMAWVPSSGKGQIFSWVIVHRTNNPAYEADAPYALILVELDEGPLFPTRLSGSPPKALRIGQQVEVDYHDVAETGMTLPLFRLSDEEG